MKHKLRIVGQISLVIILFLGSYALYKMSAYSINNTLEMIGKRFVSSYIFDPLVIWGCSTAFIIVFVGVLQLTLPDVAFGFIARFRKFLATFAALYVIYIGPIILLLLLLLFNASFMDITLVLSVLSFIGMTMKKGKELYSKLYPKFEKHF